MANTANLFLLDMDGTLLDFNRAERENLTHTLSGFGIDADDTLVACYHGINDRLWKTLECGGITREELHVRRFAQLFSEFRLNADPRAVSDAYIGNFPEVCYPYPGSSDFLKTLKERGRVYLCTNGNTRIQKRHIALAGFAPFLDGVFISEEAGADKPSAAYANYVREHIPHYAGEDAVYVGDSLTADKPCAERLGARFVFFAPEGTSSYPGETAKSYGEVLALL